MVDNETHDFGPDINHFTKINQFYIRRELKQFKALEVWAIIWPLAKVEGFSC